MLKKVLSMIVITGVMGWGLTMQGFAQNTTPSTSPTVEPMDTTQKSPKDVKPAKHHGKKAHSKTAKTGKEKTGKKGKKKHTESANTEIKPQDLTPAASK